MGNTFSLIEAAKEGDLMRCRWLLFRGGADDVNASDEVR